jgi:hypothetical protein
MGVDIVSHAEIKRIAGLANRGFYGPGIVLLLPEDGYTTVGTAGGTDHRK